MTLQNRKWCHYVPFYLNDPNDRKVPKISVAVDSPNNFFKRKKKTMWILKSLHFNPDSNIKPTRQYKSVYETLACDQYKAFKWNPLSSNVMLHVFQYHIKWIWVTGRKLKRALSLYFSIIVQCRNMFCINENPKIMMQICYLGLYHYTETIYCCLSLSMARMEMD